MRRAIVLMVLGGDNDSAAHLEAEVYDPALDRDGRIACVLDAWNSEDEDRQAQVRRIAADLLAHDAPAYRVELTAPASSSTLVAVPLANMGDRARACARGAT